MKIILSPAKKMIVDTDNIAPVELPVFIDKTAEVLNWMKSKSLLFLQACKWIFHDNSYIKGRSARRQQVLWTAHSLSLIHI